MGKINRLDAFTSNRIAAGEVVERPSSIVKELVENSIDAGSTYITVEIQGGGIQSIRVTDNGSGIEPDDCLVAFERHATSKISRAQELDSIATLGFRGEALSSIAAVAQVELTTHVAGAEAGTFVRIHGGEVLESRPAGCPEGTTFLVQNVFYNTPVRLQFLKKPATEAGYIGEYMLRMILARPDISFKFLSNGRTIYQSPGDGDLKSAIYCVYGNEILQTLNRVEYRQEKLAISGYTSRSEGAKPSRAYQSFFVNGRYIRSAQLSAALQEAYGTRLMGGRFPACVLHISLPYDAVDVNIHPNKLDVRFREDAAVLPCLMRAVEEAVGSRSARVWSFQEPRMAQIRDAIQPVQQSAFPQPRPKAPRQFPADAAPEVPGQPEGQLAVDDSALRSMGPEESVRPTAAWTARESNNLLAPQIPSLDYADKGGELPSIVIAPRRQLCEKAVEESEREAAAPLFDQIEEPVTIVGQAFGTYVLVQQMDQLYIIDQHAAHERILYNQYMDGTRPVASQQLLLPQELGLTPSERELLEQNEETFRQIGFSWEEGRGTGIQVLSVPYIFEQAETGAFLREVLLELSAGGGADVAGAKRQILAQSACKHAIKGNETLSRPEIQALLAQFGQLGVLHCPHGRPIVVRMSRMELEKMFKRVL